MPILVEGGNESFNETLSFKTFPLVLECDASDYVILSRFFAGSLDFYLDPSGQHSTTLKQQVLGLLQYLVPLMLGGTSFGSFSTCQLSNL